MSLSYRSFFLPSVHYCSGFQSGACQGALVGLQRIGEKMKKRDERKKNAIKYIHSRSNFLVNIRLVSFQNLVSVHLFEAARWITFSHVFPPAIPQISSFLHSLQDLVGARETWHWRSNWVFFGVNERYQRSVRAPHNNLMMREAEKLKERRIDARPLTYSVLFVGEVRFFFFSLSRATVKLFGGRRLQREGANETQKYKNNPTKKKTSSTVAVRSADESLCHRGSAWRVYLYGWKRSAGPKDGREGELRVNSCRPPWCIFTAKVLTFLCPRGFANWEEEKQRAQNKRKLILFVYISNVVAYMIQRWTLPVWLSPETVVVPQTVPSEH